MVQDLVQAFTAYPNLLFLDLSQLNVEQQSRLRKAVKEVGGRLLVVKKTLLRLAWEKVFSQDLRADLEKILAQPLPMAVSFAGGSPEQLPKAVLESLQQILDKKQALDKVLGGVVGGEFLTLQAVQRLASLPGKEQLEAQLLGVLQGSLRRFLWVLKAPSQSLVTLLSLKAQS